MGRAFSPQWGGCFNTWADGPGWDEAAPLALESNRPNAIPDMAIGPGIRRAKGPFHPSLGQRPRNKVPRYRRGLKARSIGAGDRGGAFSPQGVFAALSWADGPGWDEAAPLALESNRPNATPAWAIRSGFRLQLVTAEIKMQEENARKPRQSSEVRRAAILFVFCTLPPLLSDPLGQVRPMKNESETTGIAVEELMAVFGDARLVKRDGQVHLIGGSMADRTEAMEWVMMFLPDESVRLKP